MNMRERQSKTGEGQEGRCLIPVIDNRSSYILDHLATGQDYDLGIVGYIPWGVVYWLFGPQCGI